MNWLRRFGFRAFFIFFPRLFVFRQNRWKFYLNIFLLRGVTDFFLDMRYSVHLSIFPPVHLFIRLFCLSNCAFINLSICQYIHLFICPSVHLSVSLSVHLSICHLSVCHLPACPSVHVPMCEYVHVSMCPCVHLSICPSVHLPIWQSVHLSLCLSIHQLLFYHQSYGVNFVRNIYCSNKLECLLNTWI